jgi:hypothetical protein
MPHVGVRFHTPGTRCRTIPRTAIAPADRQLDGPAGLERAVTSMPFVMAACWALQTLPARWMSAEKSLPVLRHHNDLTGHARSSARPDQHGRSWPASPAGPPRATDVRRRGRLRHGHPLAHREELDFAQEVVNDAVPEEATRCPPRLPERSSATAGDRARYRMCQAASSASEVSSTIAFSRCTA